MVRFVKRNTILLIVVIAIIVIIAALVLGLSGRSANAASKSFVDRSSPCEKAAVLYEMDLFRGVGDGDLDLERSPTRAEALVMLIRMLGEEDAALSGEWEHPFTDVPAWADPYVGYAYEKGLSNGVSETMFGTNLPVSAEHFLTFMLRALGYSDMAGKNEEPDFTWDRPFELADEIGLLTEDVQMDPFRRADAAAVSYAALFVTPKGENDTLLMKLSEEGVVSEEALEATGLAEDSDSETAEAVERPDVPYWPHTPSTDCEKPLVCQVCGEELGPAPGHVPGPPATCLSDQVCTVCGAVLAEHLEHNYVLSQDGKQATCSVCGSVINYSTLVAGQTYIPEYVAGDHYHNVGSSYFANAVLVCGDYGIEYFSLNPAGNEAYANTVNAFARKYPGVNVTSLLVPKACAFLSPSDRTDVMEKQVEYINSTYSMMDEGVRKANAMGVMQAHEGEYMYYRTDHHWTSLGAYYASVAYCQANGITPRPLCSYRTVINTGFIGTLYGYSGKQAQLASNPDYTVAHLPNVETTMTYVRAGVTYKGTVLNTAATTYAGMFICGDQPLTRIVTPNQTGRKLIVFKESYGNAFVPYMADYYDEIIVVDIREETPSVASIIRDYGITDALIINNVQAAESHQTVLKAKIMS